MPIDTVSFEFQAMDDHTEHTLTAPPQDGCYVRGLYFEGARWDFQKHQLTESRPKELFTECPIVWLKPMQHREPPPTGIYLCPVYKTLLRAGTGTLSLNIYGLGLGHVTNVHGSQI